jgi:DUF1680 family protein
MQRAELDSRLALLACTVWISAAVFGCSGSSPSGNGGKGGAKSSGGVSGSGGQTTSDGKGGARNSGGVTGSGGQATSDGSGGAKGSGGVVGSGGQATSDGSGGAKGSGGAAGSGGQATSDGSGGAKSSGGVTSFGGQPRTGGTIGGATGSAGSGSGGAIGTGGRTGVGGQTVIGGSAAGGNAGGPGCSAVETTYLDPVPPRPFKVSSPLWKARLKKQLTVWLPHVVAKLSDVNLPEGGIQNFVEAGKKLAGQPAAGHVPSSAPWSNAYVHNAVEAMSEALMVDPEGDAEITAAQAKMKSTLEDWIPKILSAQEKDGYLQTYLTLGGLPHWNSNRGLHEGYTGGYFLEAAMAHYLMTNRTDARLYQAAKKLADCWESNLGPAPKKTWWESHENMEQAMTRFARFVSAEEGAGAGDKYARLAKFLLDSRSSGGGGGTYDQSDKPPLQQTKAEGHAVRAAYEYSAMADVAMTANSPEYLTAVDKIWDDLVNRNMYVNGCIGSGDTSEGFGPDYSLPNKSYCESCSSSGMLFFQRNMNLAHKESRYAALMEMALYSVLGSVNLAGDKFGYTNPLDQTDGRGDWHSCPCCVGNIPRTLLGIPRWAYATSNTSLYINLFVGSTITIENVAGISVEVIQSTDYPWDSDVSIRLNPSTPTAFAIRIRVPDWAPSTLYTSSTASEGLTGLAVNGVAITSTVEKGYAVLCRTWTSGDIVDFKVPLGVQRLKALDQVAADVGRVALKYGPMIYNIEAADHKVPDITALVLNPTEPITVEFNSSLLDGVMTLKGKFADGTPMIAIPNYARNNRGGRSIVWIRDR